MDKKSEYTLPRLLKDYWFLLKGYRTEFCFFTVILLLASSAGYLIPYFLGKIVDFFIKYQPGEPLTVFYLFVAGVGIVGSLQVILRSYGKLHLIKIGGELRKKVRVLAMSKLVDLELRWHEKENTGGKIQKIQGGGDSVYRGVSFFSNEGIDILTGVLASLVIFIFLSWKYVIFGVIYSIVYIATELYFRKQMQKGEEEITKANEKVSGKIHESASNVLAVKALGLHQRMKTSMLVDEERYYRLWMEHKNLSHRKLRFTQVFAALGYSGFLLIVGFDVLSGIATATSVFVFGSYFGRLRDSMSKLSNSLGTATEIQVGMSRIILLLDEKTRQREDARLLEVSQNWKTIDFVDVSFRYKEKTVLKNFSLTLRRGESIGLVGRSGCGKSTLAKLLLGLYSPQSGKILIDRKELLAYKQSSISRAISIVLQDSEMFNRPLIDNISISSERIDYGLLKKAIDVSHLQSFIDKLPSGIKTLIGEKGYKVSGGERQRIGIARAVYANPDFIILDESTSHLDSKTEKAIQERINQELKGKNLLLIAHRLSTLRNTDKIIVMDKGAIVDEGTFNELIRRKGLFYELYRTQQCK